MAFFLLLGQIGATVAAFDTSPLDAINFYGGDDDPAFPEPVGLDAGSTFKKVLVAQNTLNAGLWASSTVPFPEATFSSGSAGLGYMETVLNLTTPTSCTSAVIMMAKGKVPSSVDPSVIL